MATNETGQLFIISGPSGSGKDTIIEQYRACHPDMQFSISHITRPIRGNEIPGQKYHFTDRESFLRMVEQDEMLEYAEYCGNFYGTPRAPIEKWLADGFHTIVEVDVQGAMKIKSKMPDAVMVFIMPPSMQVLEKRLLGRNTESEEAARKRLHSAVKEIACAREYDYIIVNDDLQDAVKVFESIVTAQDAKTERMQKLINEVLKNAESLHW